MATVDATAGGANSNSYVSIAAASIYFSNSINKGLWASYAYKDAALIEATRLLDNYVRWNGTLIFGTGQALSWPRWWVYDLNGFLVDPHTIPETIINITCELAYWIIQNNGASFDDNTLNSLSVGPIALDFNAAMKTPGLPKLIRDGISIYGESLLPYGGEAHSVSLARA